MTCKVQNCQICVSGDQYTCDTCNANFTISNGKCAQICGDSSCTVGQSCQTSDDSSTCVDCQPDFINVNGVCTQCSALLDNCAQCSTQYECTTCEENYKTDIIGNCQCGAEDVCSDEQYCAREQICTFCSTTMQNCQKCSSPTICTATIKSCADNNCQMCEIDVNTCTTCKSDSINVAGICMCGSIACSKDTYCKLENDVRNCIKCASRCKICNGAVCKYCGFWYISKGETCIFDGMVFFYVFCLVICCLLEIYLVSLLIVMQIKSFTAKEIPKEKLIYPKIDNNRQLTV